MRSTLVVCAAAGAILLMASRNFAQNPSDRAPTDQAVPKWGGTLEDARSASKSGATIPLATFSFSPTKVKEKKALNETIVGTNPFSSPVSGTTINAVLVPLVFDIGGTVFDPTAPDSCDSGISAVSRFNSSPLVQPVPNLTFNGVNVGTVQYTDGFMRAEFWNATGGDPAYTNPLSWSTAAPVTITTGSNGITSGSGCTLMGEVSQGFLNAQIAGIIQTLKSSGVISSTKFVLFLTRDVVGSSASPPTAPGTSTCCNWGYHTVTGNPPLFYAFALYSPGAIVVLSHELAEFMNDPLLTSVTPAWGGIGSIAGCSSILEVGDPLVGAHAWTQITMNGYTYTAQEMVFFSWFFNAPGTPSLGAGGLYSSAGSFVGPSKACPPGGTN